GGAGEGEGRGRDRDRRDPSDAEEGGHRGGDVQEAAGRGNGRGQHRSAAARDGAHGRGARPGGGEAGKHHAAYEVQGGGVHPDEGRGRPAHAVLQRLPSAVLLPDDGRDGSVDAARRGGDGDAGGQRGAEHRADHPDRHGQGI